MLAAELPATVPQLIAAVGALGTAAFGLVDASKALGGSVNHIGFRGIKSSVGVLLPSRGDSSTDLRPRVIATLRANWFNGTDLATQKSIAKSLVKLNMNVANAPALARATSVDPAVLTSVAEKIVSGEALNPAESDVFGRFDLIVAALLDEAYQRADQAYRNGTRLVAMITAVVLAVVGMRLLSTSANPANADYAKAVLIGLLATPIAPIAKDLSTALATAVNTLQSVKKS